MSLFSELRRRNVFRVGAAYLLASWVLLQVVDFVLDAIQAPNWILQVFILAAAVGLLAVVVFSWVFEMTPEGIRRESEVQRERSITATTGRKLDRVIIVFLAVTVVLLLAERFSGTRHAVSLGETSEGRVADEFDSDKAASGAEVAGARESAVSERSIAVLPFLALSSGPDDEYFADGLTEEILNSLAQLPELLVTARTSAFHFKGQDLPMQEIAARLGVGTLVEGSVRRAGERLRVTAQLIRAKDGFHLWSENYDSTSSDTIAVQEDIAEKIATAMNVVLDEDRREAMRRAGLRDVEAFIAMQKGLEVFDKAHGARDMIAMLGEANGYFEQVSRRVPGYAPAYLLHSDVYIHRLMAGATGEPGGVVAAQEAEQALAQAQADYASAMGHARSAEERFGYELDLAFLSGDWRGMPARIERFAAEQGCNEPNWLVNVAYPFGYAGRLLPRAREFRTCDPLSSSAWRTEVRAHLWSGDPAEALQTALRGSELAPGEWLSMQLVFALVSLGEYQRAEAEIAARLQVDYDAAMGRLMIAGARGDREAADRLYDHYGSRDEADDFWRLLGSAWRGDRETANEVAARVDAHAFGSQALTTVSLWCLCGAPWDLSATPGFAASIAKSGLNWPPASPISFPLKDW